VIEMAGEIRLDLVGAAPIVAETSHVETSAITRSGSCKEGDTGISLVPNSESQ
jgi:hypothetical protein